MATITMGYNAFRSAVHVTAIECLQKFDVCGQKVTRKMSSRVSYNGQEPGVCVCESCILPCVDVLMHIAKHGWDFKFFDEYENGMLLLCYY